MSRENPNMAYILCPNCGPKLSEPVTDGNAKTAGSVRFTFKTAFGEWLNAINLKCPFCGTPRTLWEKVNGIYKTFRSRCLRLVATDW